MSILIFFSSSSFLSISLCIVTVCFFKTETISETDPITGLTTQHEIKQPTECKTFMLSHDVTNDFSFAPAFVTNFYAPLP